jgi:hypothetical protein
MSSYYCSREMELVMLEKMRNLVEKLNLEAKKSSREDDELFSGDALEAVRRSRGALIALKKDLIQANSDREFSNLQTEVMVTQKSLEVASIAIDRVLRDLEDLMFKH